MSKNARVCSAVKSRPNAPNLDTPTRELLVPDSQSKFKQRYEVIRSARERSKPIHPEESPSKDLQPTPQSRSKFLQKFDHIRTSRQDLIINFEEQINFGEELLREQFEHNRKKLYVDSKFNNISIQKSIIDNYEYPSTDLESVAPKKHRRLSHAGQGKSRPITPTIEYVQLVAVPSQELIFKRQQQRKGSAGKVQNERGYVTAYWKRQNKFVSLIPLERNERLDFEHPNILPIYGQICLNNARFVISDEYKNCSLKHLLEEFGPFSEELGKRYLKQIALGLQHMHFKKRSHNRLSLRNILYNKNGELFVNALSATSLSLSKEETASGNMHFHAPEFLITRSLAKSGLNDVWALGCLAILMLTPTGVILSPLHPYNWVNFPSHEQETMVDNIRQLHATYFSTLKPEEILYRMQNAQSCKQLSESATNFIASCLEVVADRRPKIENLLEHEFLEGI